MLQKSSGGGIHVFHLEYITCHRRTVMMVVFPSFKQSPTSGGDSIIPSSHVQNIIMTHWIKFYVSMPCKQFAREFAISGQKTDSTRIEARSPVLHTVLGYNSHVSMTHRAQCNKPLHSKVWYCWQTFCQTSLAATKESRGPHCQLFMKYQCHRKNYVILILVNVVWTRNMSTVYHAPAQFN